MKTNFLAAVLMMIATSLSAQKWETSLDIAKAKAEKEGKNIVLTFSGSDWCISCMKLEKNIWESSEFIGYSKDYLILLRADFPKKEGKCITQRATGTK